MLVRQNIFSVKVAHSKVILLEISYSQPHPILIDIADKFDFLFINVSAEHAVFIGRLSQIL